MSSQHGNGRPCALCSKGFSLTHCAPAPRVGGIIYISDDACLTSHVFLSVAYIGPKSRTERPIRRLLAQR